MNSKRQTLNFITMLAAQAVVISLIERLITPHLLLLQAPS
ncbi:Heptaprenyl diphosphate synthase component I [Streptococcus suis YB51]|nr:Heptaprenyl diphosphate synthase component I [Streptococcus suis YB51]